MILIINGSVGVGKSSVSEALHWRFDESVYLDGDEIGRVHPFKIYDNKRIDHLYKTLELLIRFHQGNGYSNFVINYVFESAGSLEHLLSLLRPLDTAIHVYWLTCDGEEQEQRIRNRKRKQLDWELKRFTELRQIQQNAAEEGFIGIEIDTTGMTSAQVAEKIWQEIFE